MIANRRTASTQNPGRRTSETGSALFTFISYNISGHAESKASLRVALSQFQELAAATAGMAVGIESRQPQAFRVASSGCGSLPIS